MPEVNGKSYSYDKKGMEAAKKAEAQSRYKAELDKAVIDKAQSRYKAGLDRAQSKQGPMAPGARSGESPTGKMGDLPGKKNMPARRGEMPDIQKGPYRGGDYKKQLLKAKLASIGK
jgi:hypothetical protein